MENFLNLIIMGKTSKFHTVSKSIISLTRKTIKSILIFYLAI